MLLRHMVLHILVKIKAYMYNNFFLDPDTNKSHEATMTCHQECANANDDIRTELFENRVFKENCDEQLTNFFKI